MLTVKAPITLKCVEMTVPTYQGFCERIRGNYEMINSMISGDDLLHAVTTPPEYLFLEEGGTNILSQTNIQNRFTSKTEILNQLLNRISVENQMPLTYQDRVYITNILQKFGIKDVNNFMHQVSLLKEETDNTNELISLYWEHLDEMTSLVQEFKEQNDTKVVVEDSQSKELPIYLHEEIMNRLQTGAIYQIVQNFGRNQMTEQLFVNSEELQMSDYRRLTQNILLNQLENTVRQEQIPLTYYHENYYENMQDGAEEITVSHMENRVTAAVLLQLIDNLYEQRQERRRLQQNDWFYTDNAFYHAVDNTVRRIQTALKYEYVSHYKAGDHISSVNVAQRREIEMIQNLLEENLEENEQTRYVTKIQQQIDGRNIYDTDNRQIREVRGGDRYEEQNQEFYFDTDASTEVDVEMTEVLEQQIRQIERQNIENRNRFVEMLNQVEEQARQPQRVMRQGQRREESLQALTDPEGFLEHYAEQRESQQTEQMLRKEQALQQMPQEQRAIYQMMEQYMNAPERSRLDLPLRNDVGLLLRDISQVSQEQVREHIEKQQETQHLREVWEQEKQHFTEQIQVRQDGDHREQSRLDLPLRDDMGMLLRDIDQISKEQRKEHVEKRQETEHLREVSEQVMERFTDQMRTEQQFNHQVEHTVQKQVALIHKSEQTSQVDEEILNELLQRQVSNQNRVEVTEQNQENVEHVTKNTQTTKTETILQDNHEMNEMIRQGVRSQMNHISDQVYHKLEKRLQNERRRRGY